MPRAMSVVWDMLRSNELTPTARIRLLLDFDRILGFDLKNYLQSDQPRQKTDLPEVYHLNPPLVDWAYQLTKNVPLVETDASHVRRARQVQRMLAAQSQRGRKIPDLLVAAAAEEGGLIVIHYDSDFDRIAAITGQRCEWIVPAGTVA